jgi:hypothetical protein
MNNRGLNLGRKVRKLSNSFKDMGYLHERFTGPPFQVRIKTDIAAPDMVNHERNDKEFIE